MSDMTEVMTVIPALLSLITGLLFLIIAVLSVIPALLSLITGLLFLIIAVLSVIPALLSLLIALLFLSIPLLSVIPALMTDSIQLMSLILRIMCLITGMLWLMKKVVSVITGMLDPARIAAPRARPSPPAERSRESVGAPEALPARFPEAPREASFRPREPQKSRGSPRSKHGSLAGASRSVTGGVSAANEPSRPEPSLRCRATTSPRAGRRTARWRRRRPSSSSSRRP